MKRISRFLEVASILGWGDADTWRTLLWHHYPGWDIGCYYCDLYAAAKRKGRCRRGEGRSFKACGLIEYE